MSVRSSRKGRIAHRFVCSIPGASGLLAALLALGILSACDTPTGSDDDLDRAGGRVFYVSPLGDDTASGGLSDPWETFARAVEDRLPGDTVLVREGLYNERLVLYDGIGEEDRPIVFAAFPGEEVVIDGDGIEIENRWGGLIHINNSSYVEVRGFVVINSSAQGIQTNYGSHYTVEDNRTFNTYSSGIMAWEVTDLVIRGNEIEEFCTSGRGGVEGHQEGLSVSEADRFEITGNEVHHGYMEGIDAKVGSKNGTISGNVVHHTTRVGIYVDSYNTDGGNIDVFDNVAYENLTSGIQICSEEGGILRTVRLFGNTCFRNDMAGICVAGWGGEPPHPVEDVEVYGNLCYLNRNGIVLGTGTDAYLQDILVYNNILSQNTRSGVAFWGSYDLKAQTAMNGIYIVNNTVVDNGTSGEWGAGGIYTQNVMVENLVIRNNILDGNELFTISIDEPMTATDYTIAYNLLNDYRNNTNPYREVTGENAIIDQPPLFVDASQYEFGLLADSPAIDSGTGDGAPDLDFDGNPRSAGNGVDIGACEYAD